ncbi:MAG: hypothetical protein JW941_12780 [Candidatus Coatesbacteria bacterium]|nr:hypothetical protein [Candidatus Coatesbacteria bacterium]
MRPYSAIQSEFACWDSETRRLLREAGLKSRELMDKGDMAAAIEAYRAYQDWRVGPEIRALSEELARDHPESHLRKMIGDHLRREEKSHRLTSTVKGESSAIAKATSAFKFAVGSGSFTLGELRWLMA